jgi:HEAT repeat protein
LTALLKHPEAEVRAAAAKALTQINSEAAARAGAKQDSVPP